MRLDLLYALSSLWGSRSPQVCPATSSVLPEITLETGRPPMPGIGADITAFVDVNVIPMDTERVLANQTVLVEGGRITALGPANKIPVPAGAVRVDGRGKYLMPGLADMHVHDHGRDITADSEEEIAARLSSYVGEGVTTIRYLNPVFDRARLLQKVEAGGPRIYLSGLTALDGRVRGYTNWKEEIQNAGGIAAYVTAAKAAGYDYVEVTSNSLYPPAKNSVIDSLLTAARRLGLTIAAHDHEKSFGKMMGIGTYGGSNEHLTAFRDTLGFPYALYTDTVAPRDAEALRAKISVLAAAAARAGLWLTPTLNCTLRKYAPPPSQLVIMQYMVKALPDAGVKLLLAGDDGRSIHDELPALVSAGLSPYQALLTGTRNVSQYFGILDSSGTVAVGKRGDLVLLYGNPLTDIQHIREPAGVMLGGRWLDRAALDQRLLAVKTAGRTKSWIRLATGRSGSLLFPIPYEMGKSANRATHEAFLTKVEAQRAEFDRHIAKVETLVDSLAAAPAPKGAEIRRQLAEEFGVMRKLVPSDRHDLFDPLVRVWLRDQARQGHRVEVVGVTSVP